MGAYAATVTLKTPKVSRLSDMGLALLSGQCAISNYNSTQAEITGITGRFKGAPNVIVSALSSNNYLIRWDATAKAFKAYYPTAASDQTPTADIVAAAASEVANDVDVGTVDFLAVGVAP